jgi:hypothetical protein
MLKFSMENTVANIATARAWRNREGAVALTLIGSTPDGSFRRTFQQATMTNDPEIGLTADGKIECEFKAVKVTT